MLRWPRASCAIALIAAAVVFVLKDHPVWGGVCLILAVFAADI